MAETHALSSLSIPLYTTLSVNDQIRVTNSLKELL